MVSCSLQPAASYFDAVSSHQSLSQFSNAAKAIVSVEQLLKLIPSTCQFEGCACHTTITTRFIGACLTLVIRCSSGHAIEWASSPKQASCSGSEVYAMNLLLCSCLLLSGNHFNKFDLFARFFRLQLVSRSTFHYHQKLYICPAIESFWRQQQSELIATAAHQSLILAGDGRNDSPGSSAKYCAYSLMDQSTGLILHCEVIDKRETELKSPNMERLGLQRSLQFLKSRSIDIEELTTDASLTIIATMGMLFLYMPSCLYYFVYFITSFF